jgi:FkbM family methyltransferase
MKKNYPKISIITPNYNCDKFLEETIKSIINQNYPNLEYIIIDGGSNDKSIEIIKKYEKFIAYWISEKDSGMYEAIQKGFDRSTGDIMAWINADDKYHPNALFTIAKIFTQNPKINWVTGINSYYNEEGETFHIQESFEHHKYSQFINPNQYIQQESTFWKRTLWEKAGSYIDTKLKYAGDFELWLRFNRYDQIYTVSTLLGGFRVHSNQLTQQFMKQYIKEVEKSLEKEEKEFFTFYNKSILKEIKKLTIQNNLTLLKNISTDISNKIKTLGKQKEMIRFNSRENTYIIEGNKMETILSTITKRRNTKKEFLDIIKSKHEYYPEVIIDVGVAQGTPEIYETFPESHFILFEALTEFENDIKSLQKKYNKMDVEFCALGKNNDTFIDINVHPDLVGSSLYLENEDSNVNGVSRKIPMKSLNSFIDKYKLTDYSILLKIDVQGAEKDVLEGTTKLFNNIDIIILEVSLFDFFNNHISFFDIIDYMKKYNYVVYDIFDFLYRPLDSALAQIDIAFVKENSKFRQNHIFATKEQRVLLNKDLTKNQSSKEISINSNNLNFSKQFNKLFEKIEFLKHSQDSYIIYGNGTVGKTIQSLIPEKIIDYVDMEEENHHPKKLVDMKFDKIIITVLGRENQIIDYLTNQLKINENKIITIEL